MTVSEGLVYSFWGLGFSVIRFRGLGLRVFGGRFARMGLAQHITPRSIAYECLWQHQSTW